MINVILVEQRLGLISGYLTNLSELASIPEDEFLRDPMMIAAAESFLRRTLEAIFDIGRHVQEHRQGIVRARVHQQAARRGARGNGRISESHGSLI